MELDIKRAKRLLGGARAEKRIPTIEKTLWPPLFAGLGGRWRDAGTLNLSAVLAYVEKRRETVAGQTVKREVGALQRSLLEARKAGLMRRDPVDWTMMDAIPNDPLNERTKGKNWSTEDIALVFEHFSQKAVTAGHLDRCRLIMLTGLRISELHRLEPGMVVREPGPNVPWDALIELPAHAAKWGHARTIPLAQVGVTIIEWWVGRDRATSHEPHNTRTTVFPDKKPNKSLAHACEQAGFSRVLTPRDLRRWYLNAIEELGGAKVAQRLGGHQNIATTGLYLQAEKREALTVGATLVSKVVTRGWSHGENGALRHEKDQQNQSRP